MIETLTPRIPRWFLALVDEDCRRELEAARLEDEEANR